MGYRAALQGEKLVLALGYSHPVEVDPPAGIQFRVDTPTRLAVFGADKELVGQIAAYIRSQRKPEPYKGKGIRYAGEQILRKAGKAGNPGRIGIGAEILDPDQRLRVCAKDPAAAWHPMMTATIVRDDFTDRRRAVATDGCEAQRFVAVDVD